jgi:hypothetical protein
MNFVRKSSPAQGILEKYRFWISSNAVWEIRKCVDTFALLATV